MAVIALDLGGTKLAGAVLRSNGRAAVRSRAPLSGRAGKAAGRFIFDQIDALANAARSQKIEVNAIGLCIPGLSYPNGRVWAPNIPGWDRYPLRQEIRRFCKRAGLGQIPVVVENDRACHILGESWLGHARGCKDAIFLAVGTGIGAGILANGRVLNGSLGTAGSIGWMALDRPFQQKYRSIGCFEYNASGEGLRRAARLHGRENTAAEVFRSFARGERLGRDVVANAVECWGMAVANLVSLFNPEIIIFGGGVFGPAVKLIPAIRREAAKWAQPIAMKKTKLRVSKLGGDAGLFGAGFVALRILTKKSDS